MKENEKQFAIVNGIAFGEESKGNTVQALVRKLNAHTVWRSGGWQGGHHIEHDDGREIALSFFGAGVFEGADTYLRHMVISPVELFQEAVKLEELGVTRPLDHIVIDQDCLTTTPFHSGISRAREILRGAHRKGTIGKGVGEAIRDSSNPELAIRAGEFRDRDTVLRKLDTIRRSKLHIAEELVDNYPGTPPEEVYAEIDILRDEDLVDLVADAFTYAADLVKIEDDEYLKKLLNRNGAIVNEVSHGSLHHPRYGFVPHVTQIDPTSRDVMASLRSQNYLGNMIRLGIVRSYLTRHGAGPFVSYNEELTKTLVETHNNNGNDWLGDFKTGHFDIVALQYALAIGGGKKTFDGLFVSYMDVLSKRKDWQVVEAYEYRGSATDLEKYFYLEGDKIVGIKVHPDTGDKEHLDHQMRLTQLLNDCSPITTTLSATDGESLENVFLSYVTDKLGVNVVGTAYGPKIADRKFHPEWDTLVARSR